MYENLMDTIGFVKNVDEQVGVAMERELIRQRRNLELIASENIVSPAVMAAMGSDQQICRGLSGQALLRRLPGGRCGGEHCP